MPTPETSRCRPLLAAALLVGALTTPSGSWAQLTTAGSLLLHQDLPGVLGSPEAEDSFGAALAVGDFDGDDFDDLAIGVPGDRIGQHEGAGLVWTFPGSAAGIDATGARAIHQDSPGVPGVAEAGDAFGEALAAGDFDGDGFDDLAVGAPREDVGSADDAGSVWVFFGSPTGLVTDGSRSFDISVRPNTVPTSGDNFGFALAAVDESLADPANPQDLVIGIPGFVGPGPRGDTIRLYAPFLSNFYGEPLSRLAGVGGEGWSLASGSLDDDNNDDLAVGSPGNGSGRVLVRQNGLGTTTTLAFGTGTGDRFGSALAIADFDADGYGDLAVGIEREDAGCVTDAGSVAIYDGRVLPDRRTFFGQDEPAAIAGVGEAGDRFAHSLATGDFDGDRVADLVVGVPFEDIGSVVNAGMFHLLYGGPDGLSATGSQAFDQSLPTVEGSADTNDHFGRALAAGDFDGDEVSDLAVGIPGEELAGRPHDHGAVAVFFGSRR
jgi:hypothetical protein